MNERNGITRLLFVLALMGVVTLSILAMRAMHSDLRAIDQSDDTVRAWQLVEVELELAALLRTAVGTDIGSDGLRVEDRVARLSSLIPTESHAPSNLMPIPPIYADLRAALAGFAQGGISDPGSVERMVSGLSLLEPALRRASAQARANVEERRHALIAQLLSSSSRTFVLWAFTVVSCGLLVATALIESQRARTANRLATFRALEVEEANAAKSRFMTMMSHELRTPMNGVMGLIALVKQSGLHENQLRLINQAERSGNHMVGLLRDMLDFSDLEGGKVELEHQPFDPIALADALQVALTDTQRRRRAAFEVTCQPDMPGRIIGDPGRVRQALTHFCSYFIETLDAKRVDVRFDHDGNFLQCQIDIQAPGAMDIGWSPGNVFGQLRSSDDGFASDTVGPMIARGLVRVMNGEMSIQHLSEDGVRFEVRLPAQPAGPQRDLVRIETVSDTTALLLHSVLDEVRWGIWTPKSAEQDVQAIVLEAAGEDEAAKAAALRARHPSAVLVAAGVPEHPSLFDRICPLPVTPQDLNAALAQSDEPERRAVG